MTIPYTGLGKRSQATPQTEPIPGREAEMAPNHGGGYSFTLDPMKQLRRFLILGTASGSYYASSRSMTKENLSILEGLLRAGRGKEAIDLITDVSTARLAPSNDPALFALARCCACDVHGKVSIQPGVRTYHLHKKNHAAFFEQVEDGKTWTTEKGVTYTRAGKVITVTHPAAALPRLQDHPEDIALRQYAYSKLPLVARTGTHWLHFQEFVQQFRGRGSLAHKASSAWYQQKDAHALGYQVVKYQNRDGWSQRDVLRLARPKPIDRAHNAIYHWVTRGWDGLPTAVPAEPAMAQIWAYEKAKHLSDPKDLATLITEYKLPWEAVPNTLLQNRVVWEALLPHTGLEAITRNLATMTRHSILVPLGDITSQVITRLASAEEIRKSGLHPIKILTALMTYKSGRSIKGDATWTPLAQIVDALDQAFYQAFQNVTPSGVPQVLGLDVSGSMASGTVCGVPGLTPRVASAALALVTAASEPATTMMAFSRGFIPLSISPRQRLDDVVRSISDLPFDYTDCSLPMRWAEAHGVRAEAFVLYTDSETNTRREHPAQALARYRRAMGNQARLIVVGMTATNFTIADPQDPGMLDVVGMSTDTPALIADFAGGRI